MEGGKKKEEIEKKLNSSQTGQLKMAASQQKPVLF